MENSQFEYSRKKALATRNAKDYFAFCTALNISPEDEILYRRGEIIVEDLRRLRTIENKLKEDFKMVTTI